MTSANVVWIHYALPRTRWYELSPDAQDKLHRKWDETRRCAINAGAVNAGRFDVRGQGEWSTVEIWYFEDVETAYAYWHQLVDAGYYEWFDASNNLGTATPRAE